jgi:hypothetical protein
MTESVFFKGKCIINKLIDNNLVALTQSFTFIFCYMNLDMCLLKLLLNLPENKFRFVVIDEIKQKVLIYYVYLFC